MALAYQTVLNPTGMDGMWTPITAFLLALPGIMTLSGRYALTRAILMIFEFLVTLPNARLELDVLRLWTLNIQMGPACQAVKTHTEENLIMDLISVIPLASTGTWTQKAGHVLTLVKMNLFDMRTILFIAKVVLMVLLVIIPIQPQDVLTSMTLNIPTVHVSGLATILTEVTGMTKPISAALLVLMEDTLML